MHWEVGCHDFTYFSTFVGDVLVKFRHDVFAAVYGGRGTISIEWRYAMTTEPGHIMFVDNFGMSRVVVVVVIGRSEERFKVCHEEERDGMVFESCWVGERVKTAVTHVCVMTVFGSVCH